MPLLRSSARRADRKDKVSPLLVWNGEAEDAASGDDWQSRWVTCIAQRAPNHRSASMAAIQPVPAAVTA